MAVQTGHTKSVAATRVSVVIQVFCTTQVFVMADGEAPVIRKVSYTPAVGCNKG